MIRHGYSPQLAVGVVAGSSVLGMLIPPSLLLIVFGILSEASIGALFLGGVIPGILLALLFCATIALIAYRKPEAVGINKDLAPQQVVTADDAQIHSWWQDIFKPMIPIAILVGFVIGGLYGGIFTATESGAVAALASFIIAIVRRKLSWRGLWNVLQETGHITAAICILIIAASAYSRMLALSGLPGLAHEAIVGANLGMYGTLLLYIALIIFLGTFLDSVSILLLTVPLAVPVFSQFGVDLIWLGVVTVVAVEVGLLTPPLGIAAFVVKSTLNDPRITLIDVFKGSLPFVLAMLVLIILMIVFPFLVTGIIR
jgi:C4-dicarboxylate transporter, DctM subunit